MKCLSMRILPSLAGTKVELGVISNFHHHRLPRGLSLEPFHPMLNAFKPQIHKKTKIQEVIMSMIDGQTHVQMRMRIQ